MTSPSIQQERARILEQMAQIDRMIRGHVANKPSKSNAVPRPSPKALTSCCSAGKTVKTTASGSELRNWIPSSLESKVITASKS